MLSTANNRIHVEVGFFLLDDKKPEGSWVLALVLLFDNVVRSTLFAPSLVCWNSTACCYLMDANGRHWILIQGRKRFLSEDFFFPRTMSPGHPQLQERLGKCVFSFLASKVEERGDCWFSEQTMAVTMWFSHSWYGSWHMEGSQDVK